MMKSRLPVSIIIALLIIIIGSIFLLSQQQNAATQEVFEAVINRDCAPWDGAAFTITIPLQDGFSQSDIVISIWQSPALAFPANFTFPDETGRIGSALYRSSPDTWEQLRGKVSFRRVQREEMVEGIFSFSSEDGEIFEGRFVATWGDQIVYCG